MNLFDKWPNPPPYPRLKIDPSKEPMYSSSSTTEKTFYVWVNLLTDVYQDGILAKLVKRGFEVGALADDGCCILKGEGSALLSLRLAMGGHLKKSETLDVAKVTDELKTIMGELKALYHSIIAHQVGGEHSWCSGNIRALPKKVAETEESVAFKAILMPNAEEPK